MSLNKSSKLWFGALSVTVAAQIVAACFGHRSFGLTAFSDVVQCVLLLSGTVAFVPLAMRTHGRTRFFWILIISGLFLWFSYQFFWTYYELVLREDVPDLCAWDVVLFLHLVPLTAALGLRPQIQRDEYSARVGRLDFALLLLWWFYLYVVIVMPWQYVVPNTPNYNQNLNNVYSAEKFALLIGLFASWLTSTGEWKKLYRALFWMTSCYSAGSTVANWAIARKAYYSGSVYDIPLVAAMASLSWIGLRTKITESHSERQEASTVYGIWVARCGMIAVFSLALFALWSIVDSDIPSRIRTFRLAATFLAAFCMGIMVLLRQHMLDRELVRLLRDSRESFENLKRLQAQILQSEKLASIGKLVGGAAHELNNPITAMLGYSDLLLNSNLSVQQHPLAERIGLSVRRTKSLVASLISFARQNPASKTPLDLNTLSRTAVKLTEPQWQALQIDVRTDFDPDLPKVMGDSNQLLQVCQQLLGNCLHLLSERRGHKLTVSTRADGTLCRLQIETDSLPGLNDGDTSLSAAHHEDSLGLAACKGILQEHTGEIFSERRKDGALLLRVQLPSIQPPPISHEGATVQLQWQSRPYA